MSKFVKQNIINENGRKLFKNVLDSKFFLLNDFSDNAGQDSYPDIDGLIRLRDGNENYLNLYLHYQLKSTNNLKEEKYSCSGDIFDYLVSTNVPTLLIIADVTNQKVYWFYLDDGERSRLSLKANNNSGKTISVGLNMVNPNDSLQLNQLWQKFAQKDNYQDLNNAVNKITASFNQDIQKCLGILYLLKRVLKKEIVRLFDNLLKTGEPKIKLIIDQLIKEGVITVTANFYILDNEQLGIESLYKLLQELNLATLENIFKDQKDRARILSQLAKIEHPAAQSYFDKLSKELFDFLLKSNNNDELFSNLELLQEYAFRVSSKSLEIVRTIIQSKPVPPIVMKYKGFPPLNGKSHEDLINKCIDICAEIRYIEKDVFDILVNLCGHKNKSIGENALKVIKSISKYNIHVLRKVGYGAQIFVLEKIERWNNDKLIKDSDTLINISAELLEPSFAGTSMPDYKTFTFHRGSLNISDELKNIRNRTLAILKKLYSLTGDIKIQKKILQAIEVITHTPDSANYGKDMEQMVIENTNSLIEYYLSILSSADNEIIKHIEEQSNWFSRRFGNQLARLSELKTTIASKTEYDMFRIFVGFDGRFEEDMDWNKAKDLRSEKIQQFIKDINKSNFSDWERKILSLVKNYSVSDPGEFQYFNLFLNEFSKQKPDLAFRLIGKQRLDPFLIHIIAGLWNSSSQEKVKKLVVGWIKAGKYLPVSAFLFDYVESINVNILNNIFNKAKKAKDLQALNNIIRAVIKNYSKQNDLKELFIKTIIELANSKNYWWINNFWYRGENILNDFGDKDFDILLSSLIMLPNIAYQAEEVLMPVSLKYPEKVINFFHHRVLIKSRRKSSLDDRYDAIPFNLHKINEPLRKHESIILPMILSWYGEGNPQTKWLFQWEASHLLEEIFPSFSPLLEKTLIDIINSGQNNSLEIIFSVMGKHKGEDFLWGVVRATIIKFADNKKYKEVKAHLFGYLSQTGVVSGEYGFVDSMKKKREQIQKYKNDTNREFKTFVQEYETHLNQRIDYEQKVADEEIELRKKEIGKK